MHRTVLKILLSLSVEDSPRRDESVTDVATGCCTYIATSCASSVTYQ